MMDEVTKGLLEAQTTVDAQTVDRAWARFCGAFGDGPDAPYPGMIAAFEIHYGQSFRDKEWRTEAACWAAAWSKATARAEAALVEPDSLHAGEPVEPRSDEDKARLRKALDAALQRPPTRDEVIRMALKAGFTWEPINNIADPLERFAGLVASAERKACIAITKEAVEGATISKYATSLEVLAARGMATHLIDAIRARGKK